MTSQLTPSDTRRVCLGALVFQWKFLPSKFAPHSGFKNKPHLKSQILHSSLLSDTQVMIAWTKNLHENLPTKLFPLHQTFTSWGVKVPPCWVMPWTNCHIYPLGHGPMLERFCKLSSEIPAVCEFSIPHRSLTAGSPQNHPNEKENNLPNLHFWVPC